MLVTLVLLLAGGGAFYALQRDDAKAPVRLSQQPSGCLSPRPTTAPPKPQALPQPAQIQLALLNGTSRNGLAKSVGDQLAANGFVVTTQGNAPSALGGASQVSYAHGAEAAAFVMQRWVIGAVVVRDAAVPRGTVRVTLGSDFHGLAAPAEAAAGLRTPAPTATAAPVASGCPS